MLTQPNDLWKKNASHANRMAQLLAQELEKIPYLKLTHPVETNGVFAIMDKMLVAELQKEYFFMSGMKRSLESVLRPHLIRLTKISQIL